MKWIFLFFFALAACTQQAQSPDSAKKNVSIFYNNDNFGYLDPCGCRVSPIGSMHRRWNAMLPTAPNQRIFLDAGNIFFKSLNPPDYLHEQWIEQAKGVVEAYNLLAATAATPGENDFALGTEAFLALTKEAKFPFLAANLIQKNSGKLLLKDSLIIDRGGMRIGIFGIYSPDFILPDDLMAQPVLPVAKAMVEKLRKEKVDMVIALSHQGMDADKVMAANIKGIDLIIGAHSQSLLQDPYEWYDTRLVQLSSQGQMLGLIRYGFTNGKLDALESKVAELDANYDVSPDPKVANPMKALVAVTNMRIAAANKRLDDKLWLAHQGNNTGPKSFLQCRDCHNTQAKFQEGLPHAAAFLTLVSKKQERNLDCIKCHSVGFQSAGGFANLSQAISDGENKPIDYQKVLETAGLKDISLRSYRSKDNEKIRPEVSRWIAALKKHGAEKALVGVQCENCHGTLADHPFGDLQAKHKSVQTKLCLQCHTQEQMPDWYDAKGIEKNDQVKAAIKKISCPRQ